MKRMNFVWGILVAVFVLCLSACRSTKNITQTDPHDDGGAVEWVDKMALSGLKEGTVTSKMNLDLNLGGKSLSVGGSCNLKRDEVIQLSLVAMGFMEVGRLEFTPQYMMMVNRMGREYVKVDYADVPYLQQAGCGFPYVAGFVLERCVCAGTGRPLARAGLYHLEESGKYDSDLE